MFWNIRNSYQHKSTKELYYEGEKSMEQFIIRISTCKSFTTKTGGIHILVNILNLLILFLFQIIVIAYFSIHLL